MTEIWKMFFIFGCVIKRVLELKFLFFHAKNERASKKIVDHIRESKELLTLADSYIGLL
jgi:hypothetical protein